MVGANKFDSPSQYSNELVLRLCILPNKQHKLKSLKIKKIKRDISIEYSEDVKILDPLTQYV